MQKNTQSENSDRPIETVDLINEALDMLDHARNMDDLRQSLVTQGEIVKFLIWLIDDLEDPETPENTIKIHVEFDESKYHPT